jgi:hypothetical protein
MSQFEWRSPNPLLFRTSSKQTAHLPHSHTITTNGENEAVTATLMTVVFVPKEACPLSIESSSWRALPLQLALDSRFQGYRRCENQPPINKYSLSVMQCFVLVSAWK